MEKLCKTVWHLVKINLEWLLNLIKPICTYLHRKFQFLFRHVVSNHQFDLRFQFSLEKRGTVKLGISAFLKICNHHILWSEKVPWDILRIAVTIINYHKMGSKKILAFFFKTISSCVWFHSFQYGGSKNQSVLTAVKSAAAAVEQCASNRRRPSVLLVVLPIRDSNQKCIQQT